MIGVALVNIWTTVLASMPVAQIGVPAILTRPLDAMTGRVSSLTALEFVAETASIQT
jgi:hypothetical protein